MKYPKQPSLLRRHFDRNNKAKVGYRTLDKAQKACTEFGTKTGEEFSTYYCPICGRYHIGHREK